MRDEITPRHQKAPGESGDRNLGGYFVLNFPNPNPKVPAPPDD
jgi:hypothetical protein